MGLVKLQANEPSYRWDMLNERRYGGITTIATSDLTGDGVCDIVVGRDDGVVEVYGFEDSDEPRLKFTHVSGRWSISTHSTHTVYTCTIDKLNGDTTCFELWSNHLCRGLVGHKLYKNVMGGREGLKFDALALHVSSIGSHQFYLAPKEHLRIIWEGILLGPSPTCSIIMEPLNHWIV